MTSKLILAAAAMVCLAAPAYAGSADNGGGWRSGERDGWSKNRDYPGETNGFARQDYRALQEAIASGDPVAESEAFGNLSNTMEGYVTRDALRGVAGNSGKVPGASSQRQNGLPSDLRF